MAEILEHVIIELLGIINSDLSRNAIATDYVLLEEFIDGRGAYICDELRLDPFRDLLDRYDSENVVALGWS
jgi:hypothetical protein